MAGSASTELRSAHVAEATSGTTPATPAFVTNDVAINMSATPMLSQSKTMRAGGAIQDQTVRGMEYTGSMSGPLIYGNYDGWLETLLQAEWATNVLKNGKANITRSVENTIPAGAGGTNTMMRYRGVQAPSGTITANSEEEIGFSFDLFGTGSDAATTTALTGATYSDPSNTTPMVAGLDVGTITIGGYTLDCMSRVEMQFEHEERGKQTKIGSFDYCGVTRGALIPVINASMYIEANFMAIFNAARGAHSEFAVTIPLGNVSGSKYTFEFPRCKFGSAVPDFGSKDAMLPVTINPMWDVTEDCVVKITRGVT